jgi:hypothetical protein
MARALPSGTELYNALRAEGFDLPDECGDVQLLMPIDGIFQLHYAINVTGENLAKLGRALTKIGESHQDDRVVAVGWRQEI